MLVACGPRHVAPQVDWSQPPQVVVEQPTLPAVRERVVEGLRVVVVENHRLPLVSISAVSTSAGGRAAWKTPGLASVCVEAIARSVTSVAVDTSVATEYAALEVATATDDAVRAAGELAKAIREPQFHATFGEALQRVFAGQTAHRDAPRSIAGRVLDRVLFPSHPYQVPAEGTHDTLQAITIDKARAFAQTAYAPGTLTLVIVGDADDARVAAIAHEFASFASAAPAPDARTVTSYVPTLGIVERPGAPTSVVLVGAQSDPGGAPGQLAADLANLMLGGGPGAQLDRTLHDTLKVTLGAGSSHWRGRLGGSWSVAASFPTERTIEGLRATLGEIAKARRTAPTPAALAKAKATQLRALASSFETTVGATRALERMIGQGLTAEWYATYVKRLDAITPHDVQMAASKWNDLSIVVVGDWQKLRGELTSFGLPVTTYEP
jgi:predicted Zn-dependent peptidase